MVLLNDSSLWQPSSVSPEKATTFQGIERGFTCFGMFCNLVLLPLIMFKSPTDMGVYKFLMVYIAVFELFFGWLELMTVTNLYTQGSLFTVVVDPDEAFLPDGLLQISCLIYCGSFATSLAMFGVQFAYRYQVLKGNSIWTSRSSFTFFFWGSIPLLVALMWTLSCSIYLGRNDYVVYAISQQSYPISLENKTVGFVAVYFYPGLADGSTTINWDSFIGMSLCTCILFGSESLMLYFALKSYLVTKSLMTSAYSANFQKLQWQLFYALVSQAVIPIFFMQIPLSAIYITLFANISTPFFGHLQELTISFYLATDALPTIFIIKPYREFIFSTLRCLKLCKSANSANQVGTHTAISLADIPSRYIVSS
ncbi:Seven TM Receptor [Caenorhabditis elegans]|uniref:Seven TM Receptor n=1 Tax=Caenorhabditis elegans TaxID=6239 RepID=O62030_CAEEL|nr:Seven TM Receptor [Caenorhabditis elegans]CAB07554.2 Seven TM Receptor [Caenorhabditis elegans]|eukprot:NP_001309466.1 Seven TM Receptor [Caenorhabditis elegans]